MDKAGGRVLKVDPKPQVTGALLLSRVAFLREQGGTALEQVLRRLEPAHAAVLVGTVLSDAWYPVECLRRVDEVIASVLSHHDPADVLVHLGRSSADAILGGTEGGAIRRGAPGFFLAQVPRLYASHHTAGSRACERASEYAAVIRACCEPCLSATGDCWTIVGWLQRGLELSGAQGVIVAQAIRRGDKATTCQFSCEWC